MARRPPRIPADTWPPRMLADMAAGYCGEKHVEDFLERVGALYPQPRWIESQKWKFWYRGDLDKALGIADAPTGTGERGLARILEKRAQRQKRGD